MAKESGLHRRGKSGKYYYLAYIPPNVRHLIPGGKGGQKWVALDTTDIAEAKRRKRIAAVEMDQEIQAALRRLRGEEDVVSEAEAQRLATLWLSRRLEEDEEERRLGLDDTGFRKAQEIAEILDIGGGHALATGDTALMDDEVEELVREQLLSVPEASASWKRIAFALLKAQKRYAELTLRRQQGDVIETPAPLAARPDAGGVTVQQLIDDYMADPSRNRTPSTEKTYNTIFRALKELFGADTPVSSIHRRNCERIRDILVRLPKNATLRFRGLTLEQTADLADRESLERIKPATVNAYLGNLSSLFKWGIRNWRVERNPAEGLLVNNPVADIDQRSPFSLDQLKAIFNAPLYVGCVDDDSGYAKPGPNVIRRGRFWVPLLSLWTGMRLGECCQLHTEDIAEVEGVPCIFISPSAEGRDDDADRKRVKTAAGRRFVPVHPELEKIGFLSFVAEARRKGEKRLFPELEADKQGYLSGNFGKWFNDKRRFLGKVGIAGSGVSFHSFRHNYRDALRQIDISLQKVRALGGWRRDSDGEEARYGKGLTAAVLYEDIKKVSYGGLDLSHLYASTGGSD